MAAPSKVNYGLLEPDWRAGIKSAAQMAAEYTATTGVSVSRVAITKHFEKLGIPRDLTAKIRAKAEAMVAESLVTGEVSTATTATDAKIIEAAAVDQATVRVQHRQDIAAYRKLSVKLLRELEALTDNKELFENLYELLHDPVGEDDPAAARERERKRREAFDKVMSLPGRQKTMKEAAETLRVLVALEREAHGIGPEEKPPEDPGASVDKDDLARRVIYMLAERCKIGAN